MLVLKSANKLLLTTKKIQIILKEFSYQDVNVIQVIKMKKDLNYKK